jgi:hypothetical protein
VSACLFSGPEGPMILIGSSVASAFTRGLKVVSCFRDKFVIGTNLMSRLLPRLPQHSMRAAPKRYHIPVVNNGTHALKPLAGSTTTATGVTSSLQEQQVSCCRSSPPALSFAL